MTLQKIKLEMCEIGHRIYNKGFAAGNDGNITYRLSKNKVLCTPTLISKGFMKPADLCIVDMNGKQLSGKRKPSSEIRLHLTILRERPDVKSVVHCHPPHATAFAVAREPIPQCVLPEIEVFLGEVPITPYKTPGTQEFADTVLPYVKHASAMILSNHGTVSFGETLERAFWWTEILDAYCRILMLARGLGKINYFTESETRELLEMKQKWGFKDPRLNLEMKQSELRGNDMFRSNWKTTGAEQLAFEPLSLPASDLKSASASASSNANGVDQEQLVRLITQQVLATLRKQ